MRVEFVEIKSIPDVDVNDRLGEHVLPVRAAGCLAHLLNAGKVHEVGGAVDLVVELLRVGERQLVPHVGVVAHTHEVVVPRTLQKIAFQLKFKKN